MAVASGRAGAITFASGYVAKARSWTISIEADAIDASSWDDYSENPGTVTEWDTYVGGRCRWSGSFTALVDVANTVDVIPNGIPLGGDAAAAAATFTIQDDADWSGNIIITGIENTLSYDGVAEITYSFRGTGALTYTPNTA